MRQLFASKEEAPPSYGSFPQKEDAPPTLAPPQRATWGTAGLLIIADIVGIGVMGVASAFAQLGWVPALCLCIGMLPLNIFCGILVWEAQTVHYPGTLSMADIGGRTGGAFGYHAAAFIVYSFIFMVLGNYLLTIGICLEQFASSAFPGARLSRHVWSLLGVVVLLPFVQLRTLNATRSLLWVNVATIVLSVGLALGYLLSGGELVGGSAPTAPVATDLSWRSFMSGLSKLTFAYVGTLMYPEIVAEMAVPSDFPKALYAGAPFQLSLFTLVGCVGYATLGSAAHGLLIEAVPPGPVSALCALSLAVHLVITYLIKGTVLTRALHKALSPATLADDGRQGTIVWFGLSSGVLVATYGVASAVPFFDDLMSLLGSLQTPLFGFCLPVIYRLYAAPAAPPLWLLLATIFAFGVVMTLVGTVAATMDVVDDWGTHAPS